MANVTVYNMEGNEVGTMELNDAVFGVEVNEHLVHLAVVRQLSPLGNFDTNNLEGGTFFSPEDECRQLLLVQAFQTA